MIAENFSLEAYFTRISWSAERQPLTVDITTLTLLMQQQLRHVPFENLDVQAGQIVSLEPTDIVRKILHHNRGGYCYEVNGLFAMLLTALDIPYQFVFCRPMFYPMRRPKTHMALIVTLPTGRYLCDLGFGSYGIRAPIALADVNLVQQQDHDQFRLISPEPGQYVLQAWLDGHFVSQYGFDLYPAEWIDFMPANYLNSTHPDTIFVQKLLVLMQHETGRKLLIGNEFKQQSAGELTVSTIAPQDIDELLWREFGLKRGT
jgi:N-hydroxyarylamine O-acetyltransferase